MSGDAVPDLRVIGQEEGGSEDLVAEYIGSIGGRLTATVEAYERILRRLTGWVAQRPGRTGTFRPELLTRTAVETYISELGFSGYSESHRAKVKSAISGFAGWLAEDREVLRRNPARGIGV